jgi:hypothetical protein
MLHDSEDLDKRSSQFGIEYRCELGLVWLSSVLVKEVPMGGVRIRSYENGLIRAGPVCCFCVGSIPSKAGSGVGGDSWLLRFATHERSLRFLSLRLLYAFAGGGVVA